MQVRVVKADLIRGAGRVEALLNPLPLAQPRPATFADTGREEIREGAYTCAQDRMPMRDDVRQSRAGGMQLLVHGLRPDTDEGALER